MDRLGDSVLWVSKVYTPGNNQHTGQEPQHKQHTAGVPIPIWGREGFDMKTRGCGPGILFNYNR